MPLYLEILPLLNSAMTGIEYIVKAYFKTTDPAIASAEPTNLAAYLESKSWFLAEDPLKTELIMERYGYGDLDLASARKPSGEETLIVDLLR
jgi:hypothetical protein